LNSSLEGGGDVRWRDDDDDDDEDDDDDGCGAWAAADADTVAAADGVIGAAAGLWGETEYAWDSGDCSVRCATRSAIALAALLTRGALPRPIPLLSALRGIRGNFRSLREWERVRELTVCARMEAEKMESGVVVAQFCRRFGFISLLQD